MTIRRLNHAVLFVRDADASARFYREVLGFRDAFGMDGARFLQAPGSDNDHDLGLFTIGSEAARSAAGRGSVGLYHLAWEVETLGGLRGAAHSPRRRKARSSDRATTAPPRASTRATWTGSSSRSAGSFPERC